MSLRNTLRKAASLLVEMPPEPSTTSAGDAAQADVDAILARMSPTPPAPTMTVEQIVHESPGPNLDQIRAVTA
ncbi:MAG: hypothetical protein LC772_09275, partial [Chloroflexi bacterium]|nr:hypothetical protein [Chloroflexota bacterium]